MIALLLLAVTAGAVLAGYTTYRRWLLERRHPGGLLQEVVKPGSADGLFWASGIAAVLSMMGLMVVDPVLLGSGGWVLILVFAASVFEVACWASGLYRYAFFERGLWYGRVWYPYPELRFDGTEGDRVRLVARGRPLTFRSQGALAPEVRLKLAVEGFA